MDRMAPRSFEGLLLCRPIHKDHMENRGLQERIVHEISKELEEAGVPCYVEGPPDACEEWANIHVQTANHRSITLTLHRDQFIVSVFAMSLSKRLKEVAESRITSDAYGHRDHELRKELADPDSLEWAVDSVMKIVLDNDGRTYPVVVILEMLDRHRMLGPASVRFGRPYYASRYMARKPV